MISSSGLLPCLAVQAAAPIGPTFPPPAGLLSMKVRWFRLSQVNQLSVWPCSANRFIEVLRSLKLNPCTGNILESGTGSGMSPIPLLGSTAPSSVRSLHPGAQLHTPFIPSSIRLHPQLGFHGHPDQACCVIRNSQLKHTRDKG